MRATQSTCLGVTQPKAFRVQLNAIQDSVRHTLHVLRILGEDPVRLGGSEDLVPSVQEQSYQSIRARRQSPGQCNQGSKSRVGGGDAYMSKS